MFKKIKEKLRSASVASKIVLTVALSCFVTLALLTSVLAIREWSSFQQNQIDQLASVSRILASNSEAALVFNDPITASEYLESLSIEEDVMAAVLYDASGASFARYSREGYEGSPPWENGWQGVQILDDRMRYSKAVEFEGERVGTLVVEADASSMKRKQVESALIMAGLFLVGMIVSYAVAMRFQVLVTGPLDSLAKLAQRVSGERNYAIRARKDYDDEVGSLVENFNFMLESIEERDNAISDQNKNLERLVEERTADLMSAMEGAKSASRAKTEFLSTMSHELRTPMNAIVGMSSLLIESETDEEKREFLEIVRSSSDTLLALINDVLDYSKIESGKLDLESVPFELASCLEGATNLVAAQARDARRLFIIHADAKLPSRIVGDEMRLRQILVNLLGNAAKFTREGRVVLEVTRSSEETMLVSVSDTGVGIPEDRLEHIFQSFSQADSSTTRKYGGTGLGLAISQKLARAMGSEIRVESELGKGSRFFFELPIAVVEPEEPIFGEAPVSAAVELLGFDEPLKDSLVEITKAWGMEASLGQGIERAVIRSAVSENEGDAVAQAKKAVEDRSQGVATILVAQAVHADLIKEMRLGQVVTLPVTANDLRRAFSNAIQEAELKKRSPAGKLAEKGEVPGSGLRILLAEDNDVNRKVFKIMMRNTGALVDIVTNGQEAYEAVSKMDYQMVFMDLQMPGMGGIESCELIRSLGGEIAQPWIIGFTANVSEKVIPEMKEAGMDDFLLKPVKLDDLQSKLDSYADKAREY